MIVSWEMIKEYNISLVPPFNTPVILKQGLDYTHTGEIVFAYSEPKSAIVAGIVIRNLKGKDNSPTTTTTTTTTTAIKQEEEDQEEEEEEEEEKETQEPTNNVINPLSLFDHYETPGNLPYHGSHAIIT